MSSLYLWDGSHLAFRAHCAFPSLTLDDFPVSAIYGATKILATFVSEWVPGKIIMPFDIGKSSYRLGLYPQYKSGREDDPKRNQLRDTYAPQLPILIELLQKFGITTLANEIKGIEGDDAIAYLVHQFHQGKFPNINRVVIISSDKDLCQLVADKVVWYDPIKKDLIKVEDFEERFGIKQEQYIDYKILTGDKSDSVPHPHGIGPTNAVKLLQTYGSVNHLLDIKHAKIEPYREIVELSRALVTLDLHDVIYKDEVWQRIDQKISEPCSLATDLEDILAALKFESILENWNEITRSKFEAFTSSTSFIVDDKKPVP